MKRYVLDTSALLCYLEKEEGVEILEHLFDQVAYEEIEIFISIVSCIEIFYISQKQQSEQIAEDRLSLLPELFLTKKPITYEDIRVIGKIKAENTISFADSCIAGLAKTLNATLVHKDPEYEQLLNEIDQLKLPYKQKNK